MNVELATFFDDPTRLYVPPETRVTHVASIRKLFFELAIDVKWRELRTLYVSLTFVLLFVSESFR